MHASAAILLAAAATTAAASAIESVEVVHIKERSLLKRATDEECSSSALAVAGPSPTPNDAILSWMVEDFVTQSDLCTTRVPATLSDEFMAYITDAVEWRQSAVAAAGDLAEKCTKLAGDAKAQEDDNWGEFERCGGFPTIAFVGGSANATTTSFVAFETALADYFDKDGKLLPAEEESGAGGRSVGVLSAGLAAAGFMVAAFLL